MVGGKSSLFYTHAAREYGLVCMRPSYLRFSVFNLLPLCSASLLAKSRRTNQLPIIREVFLASPVPALKVLNFKMTREG